jgi:uncharacterized protein (DUF362 family)
MQIYKLSTSAIDPDDKPIVGVKNIAGATGLEERQVWHLIRTKKLPHKRMGKHIVSTARALKAAFKVEA